MKKKAKKLIIETVKAIITIIAIGYVFSKIDVNALLYHAKQSRIIYLIAALICFIISKILSSFRLNIYFKNIGIYLSERQNLKLYLLGMFYNIFLPGGIGGDGYKIWLLHTKKNKGVKELTFAVLIDRINGMVAICMLLVLFLILLPVPGWVKYISPFLLTIGYGSYYFIIHRFFKQFSSTIHITTIYSIGVQLMQCLCILFILLSLRITDHYYEWMFVFMISSIVAVIPFTIGGLGAREMVFLFCSQWLQTDSSIAVTTSLFFYIITIATSFTGIYYNFYPKKMEIE